MNSSEMPRPDDAGLLFRTTLLAEGYGADEIDRLLRTRRLRAVRRGVYRRADRPVRDAEEDHLLRCRAAAGQLSSGAVFGHVTAALLFGLPVWGVPLGRLHVVRDRPGGGRVRAGVHVHPAPLTGDDVVELDGLRVTSPARTAADLARTLPAEPALVTVDGALHRAWLGAVTGTPRLGAATVDEIGAVVARLAGRPGVPAARRVLGLADERSESAGESRSRLRMHRDGIPAPCTQWTVPGTDLRTDFAWPDAGVVGEFDGRSKYGRGLRPDLAPEEILWREKRREDRIRSRGLTVVRWAWSEIADDGPDGMIARLRAHLGPAR